MHKVLAIPELVALIITEVSHYEEPLSDWPLPEPALLAVGLTCHAFLEPALDCIWSSQDGIGNLIACLSEDFWFVSADEVLDLRTPTRPTTQRDWYRFDYYAKRVKMLQFNTTTSSPYGQGRRVSESLFRWLTLSRPDWQLLPTLSELHVPLLTEDFYSVHLLFGRSLEALHVPGAYIPDVSHSLSALLHLPSRSPNLKVLILVLPHRLDDVEGSVIQPLFHEVLPSLKSLTRLQLTHCAMPIPFDSFVELTSLPHLVVLSLLDGKLVQPIMTAPTMGALRLAPQNTFGALEALCLRSRCTLDDFFPIFTFRFGRIKRISVASVGPNLSPNSSPLGGLTQLIRDGCSHETLEAVVISTGGTRAQIKANANLRVPSTALQQLFCFRNITKIEVNSLMHIELDDAAFEELAVSWPRLEHLTLHSRARFDHAVPRVTLRGLAHVARFCPRLEWLGINARVCDEDVFLPGEGLQHPRLSTLEFYRAPIFGDPLKIGAFLHALFPGIAGPPDDYDDRWEGIDEIHWSWKPVRTAVDRCRRGSISAAAVLSDHLLGARRDPGSI